LSKKNEFLKTPANALLKQVISDILKMLLAVAIIILIALMMGCTSVKEKKDRRRYWLIDNEDMVLYRVTTDTTEIAIPLKSKAINDFMCFDSREFNSQVDDGTIK